MSGLLPRESVDLEPYNEKLKSLRDENDLEYIDHFDGFLLATGEIPETYFHNDKPHLNMSGTRTFLLNIDAVCKVTNGANVANRSEQARLQVKVYQGSRRKTGPPQRRGPRSSPNHCHVCSMNNHTTRECWFNGQNAGMHGRYSR